MTVHQDRLDARIAQLGQVRMAQANHVRCIRNVFRIALAGRADVVDLPAVAGEAPQGFQSVDMNVARADPGRETMGLADRGMVDGRGDGFHIGILMEPDRSRQPRPAGRLKGKVRLREPDRTQIRRN